MAEDGGFREMRCPHVYQRKDGGWTECDWSYSWQEPPYRWRYEAGDRYRTHYRLAHMPAPRILVVDAAAAPTEP